MKTFGKLIAAGVAIFAALQAVRPSIPAGPATSEVQAPPEIRRILEKDCYSCHSDQPQLSWFDQVVPAYWLVRHDILTAREHLNFSTLGSKPVAVQTATLYEAANMIQLGAMPLPSFRRLHPDAMVTASELAALKAYLAPWTYAPIQTNTAPHQDVTAIAETAPRPLDAQPEFNGLAFDSSFENWKVISTTDRGDNNTFRFILGNEIAFQAAQTGNVSPWPDGTRFAKVAWKKELGPDGLMQPGEFVQVELMLKNAQNYGNTDGWGWGRWRGLSLKPYGQDAHFVSECTGCHEPVRGNDYVYTLPITAAQASHIEAVNNRAAALPVGLPYNPLQWNAITMYVDPKSQTTATLYGNDIAMQAVRARRGDPVSPAYQPGSVLALVTWAQRDDPHWFGGRIADTLKSIEFIQVASARQTNSYRQFALPGLNEIQPAASRAALRVNFVLGMAPARLP
jgi:hypothetical protein